MSPGAVVMFTAAVLAAGGIGFYYGWRSAHRPRLTGWPQVVDFQGTPMRIVQMETSRGDWSQQIVTLTLVDEAGWQETQRADLGGQQ